MGKTKKNIKNTTQILEENAATVNFITKMTIWNALQDVDRGLNSIVTDVILPHEKLPFLIDAIKSFMTLKAIVSLEAQCQIDDGVSELDDNIINPYIVACTSLNEFCIVIKDFLIICDEEIRSSNTKENYIKLINDGLNRISVEYQTFIKVIK